MKKQTKCKIENSYWKTESGAKLYQILHRDGWEALDILNAIDEALKEASSNEPNAEIKTELENSLKSIQDSLKKFREGFYRLDNGGL